MSWSTAPVAPQRTTGVGWSTTAAAPARQHGEGWFSGLLEKVAGFNGTGTLSVDIATNYPNRAAPFTGAGALAATFAVRRTIAAAFGADATLTAIRLETKTGTVSFSGDGALYGPINDGLSAIIIGGRPFVDGLWASVTGGTFDGLSATVVAL